MRKLVVLGLLAALAWWLVSSRRTPPAPRVAVGFDDGTERTLEPGSPERELLLGAALEALRS